MIPKHIEEIVLKYSTDKYEEANSINVALDEIKYQLTSINNIMIDYMAEAMQQTTVDDKSDQIIADSKALRNFAKTIDFIEIPKTEDANVTDTNDTPEIINDATPKFDRTVYMNVVPSRICPKCGTSLISKLIYYQRLVGNEINREQINWYTCPDCGIFCILDEDAFKFDTTNTNVILSHKYYQKIILSDTVEVITTFNYCMAKGHKTEDVKGNIPVILPDGTIEYDTVPLTYCHDCKRYILLKSHYDTLSGVPVCIIIDETHQPVEHNRENIYMDAVDAIGSKLYQHGYNVKQNSKLTVEQRRKIIAVQILSGNMTKNEVFSILDRNINSGLSREGNPKDWSNAVSKWKEDRKYVESFDDEKELQEINIGRLILKYTKPKHNNLQ